MDGRGMAPTRAVEYPTRDGRPLGETDDHRNEMTDYAIQVLKDFFRPDPMTYVSGNNFIYFTEGVPADCVSPDTYVVKGVPKHDRDIFKVWEEGGHVPCFVLEVTSKYTRMEDLGDKMAKYRDILGVLDYFLFDPHRDWISGGFRGYTLENGIYQAIVPSPNGRLLSRALQLELASVNRHLRFYISGSQDPLPTREEEIGRLHAELDRLRGTQGRP